MRVRRSGQTFSFVDERKKKEEIEGEEIRSQAVGRECNGVHIIMGPTAEKSEPSRCELHERRRSTYICTHTRVCVTRGSVERTTCSLDVLFRSATNGPRRLPFNDYKRVRDTCNAFIHYHLPLSNRLRVASHN